MRRLSVSYIFSAPTVPVYKCEYATHICQWQLYMTQLGRWLNVFIVYNMLVACLCYIHVYMYSFNVYGRCVVVVLWEPTQPQSVAHRKYCNTNNTLLSKYICTVMYLDLKSVFIYTIYISVYIAYVYIRTFSLRICGGAASQLGNKYVCIKWIFNLKSN